VRLAPLQAEEAMAALLKLKAADVKKPEDKEAGQKQPRPHKK